MPTNDDKNLFRDAMGDVDPLPSDQVAPYRKRRRPEPLGLTVADEQDELADLPIETGEFLSFQRPGIQNRVFHDLERGYIPPDATLDLHGMRVTEARTALQRFLAQATARQTRCVRIIHGKGQRSEGNQPILKQKTNQWLRQRDEVMAFCSAPRWDGGTGAAYVLLSRKFGRP